MHDWFVLVVSVEIEGAGAGKAEWVGAVVV
jgi:hypothetical protein